LVKEEKKQADLKAALASVRRKWRQEKGSGRDRSDVQHTWHDEEEEVWSRVSTPAAAAAGRQRAKRRRASKAAGEGGGASAAASYAHRTQLSVIY
jgi:hypothetical protein